MSSVDRTIRLLSSIDWTFPRTGTLAKSVHSLHWFPGNFIPQIPAHLIQILSEPGDLVLDPFGGSGTTAIEAARLGRYGVSVDYVMASSFVAAGKLAAYEGGLPKEYLDTLLRNLVWPELCETTKIGARGEGGNPELARWYSEGTLSQLRYMWQLVESSPAPTKTILELIFSDILFDCASTGASKTRTGKVRRHHWGWVADNVLPKNPLEHDAVRLFAERITAFSESIGAGAGRASAAVLRQDARSLGIATEAVDLIVTSPPYVSVIDYTRANRLLYLWKNWSIEADREHEIGARYKRKRQSAVRMYLEDLRLCWSEMRRVLRPGAHAAVVLGESKRFPGTAKAALDELSSYLQLVWGPVARIPERRRVSDASGGTPTEYLAVFAKQC